ncbi:MAG TPA: TIGR03086 family metal-binding protein [Acidimicrobiales bacterium]|jgi:uncharacterized protein (TIGR03086 family)|nr:TIGR03086 family metal-binding protein [Acidimicrobiales bacterium]
MTSTLERLDAAAAGFRRRLVLLEPGDAERPTPCSGWRARELIDHAVGVVELVGNLVGTPIAEGATDGDVARFDAAVASLHAKVADPGLGATVVESPFGPMALKQLVSSVVVHDLLVHTWDLARATGGDEHLDPALVTHTYAAMTPFDEVLRSHGFADKVPVEEDADEQTRLLCFLGRRP